VEPGGDLAGASRMARSAPRAMAAALAVIAIAGAGAALLRDDRDAAPSTRPREAQGTAAAFAASSAAASPRAQAVGVEATTAVVISASTPAPVAGVDAVTSEGAPVVVAESRVAPGLAWLARHQGLDGGWSCAGFSARCVGTPCSGGGASVSDATATGLALLALLEAGYTHLTRATFLDPVVKERRSFGAAVKRGLEWLSGKVKEGQLAQDPLGLAIAAYALEEAYGLTNAAVYKGPAQEAVDQLLAARTPGRVWRGARSGKDDPFVTAWAVLALKSAEISDLAVPSATFDEVRAWLDLVTDTAGTLCGDPAFVSVGRPHPTTAALGILLRIWIDRDADDPRRTPAALLLDADRPRWDTSAAEVDAYHWYFAGEALYFIQGTLGWDHWKQWKEDAIAVLRANERSEADGCVGGSWDPEADRWGPAAGRVCVTALNTLSLQGCYRYVTVYGR
jgi:hypothetical protein